MPRLARRFWPACGRAPCVAPIGLLSCLILGTPTEDVWIAAPDGQNLHALYLPAHGRARATVLYLHGNAENLSTHVRAVEWLPAQGYSVLALDYRGYGRSSGKASIRGVHEDAAAALAWLAAQRGEADMPVIVYGQSLGASIAIRSVASSPFRGAHDVVVDVRHSQQLYAAAGLPKDLWVIPQGGHIDATRRESVRERLLAFLAGIGQAPEDAP